METFEDKAELFYLTDKDGTWNYGARISNDIRLGDLIYKGLLGFTEITR